MKTYTDLLQSIQLIKGRAKNRIQNFYIYSNIWCTFPAIIVIVAWQVIVIQSAK